MMNIFRYFMLPVALTHLAAGVSGGVPASAVEGPPDQEVAFSQPQAAFPASGAVARDARPNIVLIISDDQGWGDYGFMGHPVIKTPHLDRLAQGGLVFERGYLAAPVCRPSLASMVTGRFPFQHGVTGNDVDGQKENRAVLDAPVQAAFHRFPSFIRYLSASGYRTYQAGKWWEGSWKDGGFTGGMAHGDPARFGRCGDEGRKIGRETMQPVKAFIDAATHDAIPFFLWYAPFMPHTPHNPPERLLKKYQTGNRDADVAQYDAMCEWFDETCGDLLGYLDEKGVRENTVVLYLADNGWAVDRSLPMAERPMRWKRPGRGSKGSPYESGVRTPIVLSWPGHLSPGRVQDLAHSIDLFPTIVSLAGLKPPANLPGINLLDDKARGERDVVFGSCHEMRTMTPGDPDKSLQYLWCIEGWWKLIERFPSAATGGDGALHAWDTLPLRLYNLKDDPHEEHELSARHPEVVERLTKRIEAWREQMLAARPPTFEAGLPGVGPTVPVSAKR